LFNPLKAPAPAPATPLTASGGGGIRESSTSSSTSSPSAGLIQSYTGHGYEVLDLAVTEDNARFASVGGDRHVLLWDVATGKTLRRWTGHSGRVNAVDFGGDGSVVVSGELMNDLRREEKKIFGGLSFESL
jgi:WD40 repeat protein